MLLEQDDKKRINISSYILWILLASLILLLAKVGSIIIAINPQTPLNVIIK
jgi:hypothetical protein